MIDITAIEVLDLPAYERDLFGGLMLKMVLKIRKR